MFGHALVVFNLQLFQLAVDIHDAGRQKATCSPSLALVLHVLCRSRNSGRALAALCSSGRHSKASSPLPLNFLLMAARRSPLRKSPSSPTYRYGSLTRRNYGHRLSPRSRKQVVLKASPDSHESNQVASNPATRPVLVPLHNLRRLPSRIMALSRGRKASTSEAQDVRVGAKRKRVASTNENAYTTPRPTRSIGRFKRRRSVKDDSSEDDFMPSNGAMEIDESIENETNWMSDGSQMGEQELDDCKFV